MTHPTGPKIHCHTVGTRLISEVEDIVWSIRTIYSEKARAFWINSVRPTLEKHEAFELLSRLDALHVELCERHEQDRNAKNSETVRI